MLLVSADDPLASHEWVDYDEIGDRPVSRNNAFPTEMMATFIAPVTEKRRVLKRIPSITEDMFHRTCFRGRPRSGGGVGYGCAQRIQP